ncbi:MAG: histidinol-phosphate transaminase [Cytophagales bacterium]|nr:histidinol-phosphate transaminase [Cytophagales bacterium]
MDMEIRNLLRPHLLNFTPYSSARDEFKGTANVYLDANENAFGSTAADKYRRYPDPYQKQLKHSIGAIKNIGPEHIFLGNGSDEPIDLLIRAFCNPGKDRIVIAPPTYGMYKVSAEINDVGVVGVPLNNDFSLDKERIIEAVEPGIKIIFLCSPNNPTGNCIEPDSIVEIIDKFQGLIVLDEAYIDFAPQKSMIAQLAGHKNLVILQTFSKAWGLAALRLGMAFADPEIIDVLNLIKPPYNVNGATQDLALKALQNHKEMKSMVKEILKQKKELKSMLLKIPSVQEIYPSDANFLLVKIENAHNVYLQLIEKKVIVRDRSKVDLCEDCLRITVGTEKENVELVKQLKILC